MELIRVLKPEQPDQKAKKRIRPGRDNSGIALFMVISAVSILTILATEFTYVAEINQKMAYESLDQVKAHYLAKSGLKLSLLRLKAYATVKAYLGANSSGTNSIGSMVPKSVVEKIWNFPFIYPIPALPGMTLGDKETLDKFTKNSSLDGNYTAVIESESSKYNLNMLLPGFQPSAAPSTPTPAASASGSVPPATPNPTANPSPTYSPEEARQSLQDYLSETLNNKVQEDEGFAHEYRDFKMDELMVNLIKWADRSFVNDAPDFRDTVAKRAPFYSLTELHMIPTMDDDLYDLFSPNLTATNTAGININTIKDATLRAIIPVMTVDESTEFFKWRDSTEQDNMFKKEQDFWDYIQAHVGYFKNDKTAVDTYRTGLQKRNIRIVLDETQFKITVQATSNLATRTIEAWVTLTGTGSQPAPAASGKPATTPSAPPLSGAGNNSTNTPPDPGLKITFMRFL